VASGARLQPSADPSPAGQVTKTIVLSNGTVVDGNFLPLNAAGLNDITYDSGNGNLYIADALSNNVSVISGSTHAEIASIPVGSVPVSVTYDRANGYLYAENGLSGNVSIINGSSNQVVGSITPGSYPWAGAYDTSNGDLYFADAGSDSVAVVNASTYDSVTSVSVGSCPGSGPQSVAYDPLNGFVYVANQCSNNVSVINATTNVVVTSVAVGQGPYAVVVDALNGMVYVGYYGFGASSNVTVIDGANQSTVASIQVGIYPDSLDFDSADGYLYVADQINNTASIVNVTSNTVTGTVGVGEGPDGVAFDSATDQVYVINFYSDNTTILAGPSGTIVTSVSVGIDPSAVTYDGDNGRIYIANIGSNNLTVVDGITSSVVGSISVGSGPDAVAYDGQNGDLFVANGISGNLTVVSGATDSAVASVTVGGFPWSTVYDGANGCVYVGDIRSNTVTVVNATSLAVVGTIADSSPMAMAYDSGNGNVYVTSTVGSQSFLVAISGSTNSQVATVPIGFDPFGVAYDSENGYLYTANFGSGNVTVVDGRSNSVVTSLIAGLAPDAAGFDPGNGFVYVANLESNNLTVVNGSSQAVVGSVNVGDGPDSVAYEGDPHVVATNSYSGSASLVSSGGVASYPVAFTESGLPRGTSWFVNVTGGGSYNSTTGTVSFSELNGTYGYTVATVGKEYTSPGGSFTVNGAALSITVAFSELGAGTVSATANPVDEGQATTISTTGAAGGLGPYTYAWSGLPSGCGSPGNVSSFSCTPADGDSSGSPYTVMLTVTDGNGNVVTGTFTLTVDRALTLSVSATVNPVDEGQSTTISADVSGGSGTYTSYVWGGLPSGCVGSGSSFSCTPAAGPVRDYPLWLTVTDSNGGWVGFGEFSLGTFVLFVNPPLGAGTVSASPNPADVGRPMTISTTGATGGSGTYTYYVWSGLPGGCGGGPGFGGPPVGGLSFSCTPTVAGVYTVTLIVGDTSGNTATTTFTLTVEYAPPTLYWVTFTESGLPTTTLAKYGWTVVLNGTVEHSTTSTIEFMEPNGTYAALITGPSGYRMTGGGVLAYGGTQSVTVSGVTTQSPVFKKGATYTLAIGEAGLPTSQTWCVAVDDYQQCSTKASVNYLNLTPGSYTYAVVSPLAGQEITAKVGKTVIPLSGTLTVTKSWTVALAFAYPYAVTFTESGLVSGTRWCVTVGKSAECTTGLSVLFDLKNGTYAYKVTVGSGYSVTPVSGTVVVNGAAVPVGLTAYTVTFTETGLLSGTRWCVKLGKTTECSTGTSIVFAEGNGTYAYVIGVAAGSSVSPTSGRVVVYGASTSVAINSYAVTFTESGLMSGTNWCVKIGSTTRCSTTTTVVFDLGNGSYAYKIGAVAGYTVTASPAKAQVVGGPASVTVTFKSKSGQVPGVGAVPLLLGVPLFAPAIKRPRRRGPSRRASDESSTGRMATGPKGLPGPGPSPIAAESVRRKPGSCSGAVMVRDAPRPQTRVQLDRGSGVPAIRTVSRPLAKPHSASPLQQVRRTTAPLPISNGAPRPWKTGQDRRCRQPEGRVPRVPDPLRSRIR